MNPVIVMIDDEELGRTQPKLFASTTALEEYFKREGLVFPADEEDESILAALRVGSSYANRTHYFGWHTIEE